MKTHWLPFPDEHDYPAAESYLSLLMPPHIADSIVEQLRGGPMYVFKAKDIFRASRLPLLGVSNSHVQKNIEKIKSEKKLSPVLLVRADDGLIVADGYHRVCAVYTFDEDALIPCKII